MFFFHGGFKESFSEWTRPVSTRSAFSRASIVSTFLSQHFIFLVSLFFFSSACHSCLMPPRASSQHCFLMSSSLSPSLCMSLHTHFFFPCILPNSENRFSVFFLFSLVFPFAQKKSHVHLQLKNAESSYRFSRKEKTMCVRFYGKKEKTVERFGMWQRIMHHFLSEIVPHTRVCVRPSAIRVVPGFRLTPPVNQPKTVFFPFPLFSAV